MSRRWRLDLISGAELAHFVASRQFMMILSFSDFIFSTSGLTFFHSCLSLFLYLQLGDTPLHLACSNGHEKIVEMLVTAGADVKVKNKVRQRLIIRLWLSCRGSRRIELGGVLWLVSVVTRFCQLLSGNSCGVIFVDIFIFFLLERSMRLFLVAKMAA